MGFVHKLENCGKRVLAGHPKLKTGIRTLFQRTVGLVSKPVICEGDLKRLTPDDGAHWFFGYYDKSPWDITGRRVLCLRAERIDSAAPDMSADIYIVGNGARRKIGSTRAWNTQQGCMLGWLGGDFEGYIIYNDFDGEKYVSVIYDIQNLKIVRTINMPVYSVSRDGTTALSLDFSRLHRLRPGYGYSNIPDNTVGENIPDSPCVWSIDILTGGIAPLLTYSDIAGIAPLPSMENAEHKVNHIMINPSGTRFMLLHRWLEGHKKHTRLITFDIDGKNPYVLADEDFVSHCNWLNDSKIVAYLRRGRADGYYRLKDKTQEYVRLWRELDRDGHMTVSPSGDIVTDTYPDARRLQSLYLMRGDNVFRIARVYSPKEFDMDLRCDLHPRFDFSGKRVAIDASFSGRRAIYEIAAEPAQKKTKILTIITVPMKRDGPTISVFRYNSCIASPNIQIDYAAISSVPEDIEKEISRMGGKLTVIGGRLKNPVAYMFKLAKVIRRGKYDIVHAHGNSATLAFEMLAAFLGGAPTRIAHSRNSHCKYIALHKLLKPLFNLLYTDAYACGNEAGKWLFGNKPFTVINNAIKTSDYEYDMVRRTYARRELGVGDEILVGCVAHFTPHKNHSFLLDVFSEYLKINSSAKLVLVGDGALKGEIEAKINRLGIGKSVIMTGIRSDVPDFEQAFDIMLLTSLYEGFPNVVIEWQAAGIKSLISDTITRDCALTDLVEFLPITQGTKPWVDRLIEFVPSYNRFIMSEKAADEIRTYGYDITFNALMLKELYEEAKHR